MSKELADCLKTSGDHFRRIREEWWVILVHTKKKSSVLHTKCNTGSTFWGEILHLTWKKVLKCTFLFLFTRSYARLHPKRWNFAPLKVQNFCFQKVQICTFPKGYNSAPFRVQNVAYCTLKGAKSFLGCKVTSKKKLPLLHLKGAKPNFFLSV